MQKRETSVGIVAGRVHDTWRADWKRQNGGGPRLKQTQDRAWIARHDTDQVDLTAHAFAELPADWQQENLHTAEVAVDQVLTAEASRTPLDEGFLERAAAEVHRAWLARNGDRAPPELTVSYAELDEAEKEKDRSAVRHAVEVLRGLDAGRG